MARLIDANALLENLGEEPMVWSGGEAEIQERNDWRRFKDCVEAQDTVDAVEVVHARWIEDGYYGIPCVCSHCGNEAHYVSTFQEQFDYDWEENLVSTGYEEIKEYIRSDYCPNCGAKMDGGKDNEKTADK